MIERIVQINDLSDPKGGASKLAVDAACALAARGHQVTFITGDEGCSPRLDRAGVEIVALGHERLLARGRLRGAVTGLWNREAQAMVRNWIDANDTGRTVYHLHGWSQILSPSVFSALEPVRGRLVLSAHDFFLACPNGAFASMKSGAVCPHAPLSQACLTTPCDRDGSAQKIWRSVRHLLQRHAFDAPSSPPILAIHEAMRPYLIRGGIPSGAIAALPNPVTPFSSERIKAESNRAVLFVGRLEETKGPDLAAEAAALAGAPLTIVGEGPLAAKIRARHPRAQLLGRRSPEEIRTIANAARLLVMPSRYPEPFGLVAMEAAWSGLPVLLADTALLAPDLVRCGAGLAVDPRDTAAFADAIRRLATCDATTRAMSRAAFYKTRSLALTPEAWIQRIEQALSAQLPPTGVLRQTTRPTIATQIPRLTAAASTHHFHTIGLPPIAAEWRDSRSGDAGAAEERSPPAPSSVNSPWDIFNRFRHSSP